MRDKEFREHELTAFKSVTEVDQGQPVVLTIEPRPRNVARLAYAAGLADGETAEGPILAVEFRPCDPSTPRGRGPGVVGERTQFNGGFLGTTVMPSRSTVAPAAASAALTGDGRSHPPRARPHADGQG